MNKITKEQFINLMELVRQELTDFKDMRLGQAIFNVFAREHEEIVEPLRGSDKDPFYQNKQLTVFFKEILDEKALLFWLQSNIHKHLLEQKLLEAASKQFSTFTDWDSPDMDIYDEVYGDTPKEEIKFLPNEEND